MTSRRKSNVQKEKDCQTFLSFLEFKGSTSEVLCEMVILMKMLAIESKRGG
jgi:hypothetical protein